MQMIDLPVANEGKGALPMPGSRAELERDIT